MIALAEALGAERMELANVQFYGWAFRNRAALLPTR
jgi:pyrroloquinoline quinone biosynthesis protein E